MDELSYVLISDGSADRALMPILTWLFHQHLPDYPIQPPWADLRRLPTYPRRLSDKILTAVDLYRPCDSIFVHRDAENIPLRQRQAEIRDAVDCVRSNGITLPSIAVVPVRMTEAWLLFNVDAIKEAAGNPNGTVPLSLPRPADVENIPDPKVVLHELILTATNLSMRRRKRFDVHKAVHRIPEGIGDCSPLRDLSAFRYLEECMLEIISEQHGRQ
jgi:hypothetical protein